MSRPRLLDLFCGAGGAAMGYHRAGFEVVGVDIKPQPRFPFEFHQADVLTFPLASFHAIHASPPCQRYSRATAWRGNRADHPDLIEPVRRRLLLSGVGGAYVIENVQEARRLLRNPVMLCGSAFGLRLRRHRYFEIPLLGITLLPACEHRPTDYAHDHGGKQTERQYADAMGCEWMTVHEARQAIPPAYTEWIGQHLLQRLAREAA